MVAENRKGIALISALVATLVIAGAVYSLIQVNHSLELTRAEIKVLQTRDKMVRLGRVIEFKAKDVDGDGYWETYAPTASNTVPENLVGMPAKDAWGRDFYYCAWDLGTANNSDPTYASDTGAPPIENLTFRLISAGKDGEFQTTCDDTAPQGDDIVYDFYQEEVKAVALGAGIGWWQMKENGTQTDIYARNNGYVGIKTDAPLTPLNVKGGVVSGYTDYDGYPFFGLVNLSPNSGYYTSFIFNGVNYQRLYIAPGPDDDDNPADLYFYEYSCPNSSCNIPEVHFYADTVYFHGDVEIDGTLSYGGGGGWWSDKRFKTDVKPLNTEEAEKVLKLQPVSFVWKKNGRKAWGLIAQDVEKVIPQAVITTKDGHKAVDYETLIAGLIEVIKKQQREIEELKRKIKG